MEFVTIMVFNICVIFFLIENKHFDDHQPTEVMVWKKETELKFGSEELMSFQNIKNKILKMNPDYKQYQISIYEFKLC